MIDEIKNKKLLKAIYFLKELNHSEILAFTERIGPRSKDLYLNKFRKDFSEVAKALKLEKEYEIYFKLFTHSMEKDPAFSLRASNDFRNFLLVKLCFPELPVNYPEDFGYSAIAE